MKIIRKMILIYSSIGLVCFKQLNQILCVYMSKGSNSFRNMSLWVLSLSCDFSCRLNAHIRSCSSNHYFKLIFICYRPIYGEITFIGLVEGDEKNLTREGVLYGYVSTMIYMCIANVLLLNLLIAMLRLVLILYNLHLK